MWSSIASRTNAYQLGWTRLATFVGCSCTQLNWCGYCSPHVYTATWTDQLQIFGHSQLQREKGYSALEPTVVFVYMEPHNNTTHEHTSTPVYMCSGECKYMHLDIHVHVLYSAWFCVHFSYRLALVGMWHIDTVVYIYSICTFIYMRV